MKFRIIVSILTLVIIALFITAVVLSMRLKTSLRTAEDLNVSLVESEKEVLKKNAALESVMKELNVWEKSDQDKRKKEVSRGKYKIGIEVQANNKNLYDLIAYTVGSGFKLEYVNQNRGGISGKPVMFYYSEEGKKIAEELKVELKSEFKKIVDFAIKKGGSGGASNLITAKLIVN